MRRHPRLRPVLPPRRRPGRHPGPAERPPGPGHPARPRRPAPAVTITALAFLGFVEGNLGEAQTAVQLPAILHALAQGQWSQVLAKLGLTTACLTPAGPTSLQDVTIRCSDAWAAMNPATVSQQGPSLFTPLVTAQAEWQHALCSAWPHDPGVSGTVPAPSRSCSSTAPPTIPTRPPTWLARPPPCPTRCWSRCPAPGTGDQHRHPPERLLAATTAFIQAGRARQPGALEH